MSEPDYEGYTKSLEKILDGVTKDYWASYIDINRHQVTVGKTYLWVSAALLGAYAAAYEKFHMQLSSSPCLLIFAGIAFLLCGLAFGICLYAIPARKGYKTIPSQGWGEFSAEAYNLLAQNNPKIYATFLTSLISKIDNSFAHNFTTNRSRARLLRFTSWLLIVSFLVATSVALFATEEILTKQNRSYREESKMSQENTTNQTTQASTVAEPKLQVPVPPPAANIGVGTASTHAMDSAATKNVFITESLKEK